MLPTLKGKKKSKSKGYLTQRDEF